MKHILPVLIFAALVGLQNAEDSEKGTNNRLSKLLPVFQVVKFPNDPCTITGGSKNGTCYTSEECSSRGGVNGGSCASGFGVCCTFTLGCGASTTENCTYFESASTVQTGACGAKICKVNSNICQIRLDFNTFVITGPSTVSTSIGKSIGGGNTKGAGAKISEATRCLTDTFSITNQFSVPHICGTNTGFHVYFDASDDCNEINFQIGNVANGVTTAATRSWSIKVMQYSCNYENLAPTGCTQWFYGTGASNYVQSFNYQSGSGKHLADQKQTICVRKEAGNCKICWFADAATDIKISKVAIADAVKGSLCCNHKTDGAGTLGYDCLMIPGAIKNTANAYNTPETICGSGFGLLTATTATTVCSKANPFRLSFYSDSFELVDGSESALANGIGFKIKYIQVACT